MDPSIISKQLESFGFKPTELILSGDNTQFYKAIDPSGVTVFIEYPPQIPQHDFRQDSPTVIPRLNRPRSPNPLEQLNPISSLPGSAQNSPILRNRSPIRNGSPLRNNSPLRGNPFVRGNNSPVRANNSPVRASSPIRLRSPTRSISPHQRTIIKPDSNPTNKIIPSHFQLSSPQIQSTISETADGKFIIHPISDIESSILNGDIIKTYPLIHHTHIRDLLNNPDITPIFLERYLSNSIRNADIKLKNFQHKLHDMSDSFQTFIQSEREIRDELISDINTLDTFNAQYASIQKTSDLDIKHSRVLHNLNSRREYLFSILQVIDRVSKLQDLIGQITEEINTVTDSFELYPKQGSILEQS